MPYKGTPIAGSHSAHLPQLEAVARRINPTAPNVAHLYLSMGPRLGIRGDLAFAQALLETNYFRYGGIVEPWQNNYCSLGTTGPENPGDAFESPEEGVMAHLQHLYAYASTE
jgi:N-acetylmuramoyl-L-alanine amidase